MGTNDRSALIKFESGQRGILRPGVYKSGGGRDRSKREGRTTEASNTNQRWGLLAGQNGRGGRSDARGGGGFQHWEKRAI